MDFKKASDYIVAHKVPFILISIVVVLIVLILIACVIDIVYNNTRPILLPVNGMNTTQVFSDASNRYYLVCIAFCPTTIPSVESLINANNITSGVYFGTLYFWDTLVNNMMSELGQGVSIGTSKDFKPFMYEAFLCTQYLTCFINGGQQLLLESTDENAVSGATKLDYLSAVYVQDGIMIPPMPTFSYNNNSLVTFPSYQPRFSASPNWSFIDKNTIKTTNSKFNNPNSLYTTQFILLKTTGMTALDASMDTNGYYLNTSAWDSPSTTYTDGIQTPGAIAITPSYFPPFTIPTMA